MNKLLLDTHVLVWLLTGSESLGKQALRKINTAQTTEKLYVSSISFWEIALLVDKKKITLPLPVESWYRETLLQGLQELPLLGDIAITSIHLKPFHADPADRIIVATALEENCTLITADKKILSWKGQLHTLDARK